MNEGPKLVKLETVRTRAQDSVLEVIADLLERASGGELTGLAIAGTLKDGRITTNWSRHENTAALAGAIGHLLQRFHEKTFE